MVVVATPATGPAGRRVSVYAFSADTGSRHCDGACARAHDFTPLTTAFGGTFTLVGP